MRSHAAAVSRVLRQMPSTNCRLWSVSASTRHLSRSTHRPLHCRVCYVLDVAAIPAGRSRANNCREEQPGNNPYSWRIPANYCTPDVWQAPSRSLSWPSPSKGGALLRCRRLPIRSMLRRIAMVIESGWRSQSFTRANSSVQASC